MKKTKKEYTKVGILIDLVSSIVLFIAISIFIVILGLYIKKIDNHQYPTIPDYVMEEIK